MRLYPLVQLFDLLLVDFCQFLPSLDVGCCKVFLFLLLMEPQLILLDTIIEMLKVSLGEIIVIIHSFRQLLIVCEFHLVENLRVMKIRLKHH